MDHQPTDSAPHLRALDATEQSQPVSDGLVEDELLVEEISIDGMCGVY
ncbi:MAG: mycofactocin precursor MftA [Ilumatobacteraceae bacterium]